MKRRQFLKSGAGATITAAALPGMGLASALASWVSGVAFGTDGTRGYGVVRIEQDLSVTPLLVSDVRLHGVVCHPNGSEMVAPARRPGTVLSVIREGAQPLPIVAPDNRRFCGHAVFSPRGEWLYATENDFHGERGVIGVYDPRSGYRRMAELPSGGIGPHEITAHPHSSGRHLVVANGGILTHPRTGRAKLNLPDMRPSICVIDRHDGRLVEQVALPPDWHQLSIRHMAVTAAGTVIFGLQDQIVRTTPRPLVGIWKPGHRPVMAEPPEQGWRGLAGYVGSVAVDCSGTILCTTCPRGNRALFWEVPSAGYITADYIGSYTAFDLCGVAPGHGRGQFLVTSGQGELALLSVSAGGVTLQQRASAPVRFDNHCCREPLG